MKGWNPAQKKNGAVWFEPRHFKGFLMAMSFQALPRNRLFFFFRNKQIKKNLTYQANEEDNDTENAVRHERRREQEGEAVRERNSTPTEQQLKEKKDGVGDQYHSTYCQWLPSLFLSSWKLLWKPLLAHLPSFQLVKFVLTYYEHFGSMTKQFALWDDSSVL